MNLYMIWLVMKTIIRKISSLFDRLINITRKEIKKLRIKQVGQNFMVYGKVDAVFLWNLILGIDCTLEYGGVNVLLDKIE